jgi:hypothetical protein
MSEFKNHLKKELKRIVDRNLSFHSAADSCASSQRHSLKMEITFVTAKETGLSGLSIM